MNYFGCRSEFAIEVGECVDFRQHFTLDFYLRDVHLNRADNQAYLPLATAGFPRAFSDSGSLPWMDVYWELSFSASPESLLSRMFVEDDLRFRHKPFSMGPVTDSFSLLTFARPTDVLLLCLRNDHYGGDFTDLDKWSVAEGLSDEPVHWLTVTLARSEYFHMLSEAALAIDRLAKP